VVPLPGCVLLPRRRQVAAVVEPDNILEKDMLSKQKHEVLVFATTGSAGQAMGYGLSGDNFHWSR